MNEPNLFSGAFVLYIIAGVFFVLALFRRGIWMKAVIFPLGAGFALHTVALVLRTVASGHAPFTNMYESLSFLSWAVVGVYFVFDRKRAYPKIGSFLMLIVILLMALASSPLIPRGIVPLIPALQSWWLWLHVSVTLLGEAFFAVAFVSSILYIFSGKEDKRRLYDKLSYKAIAVGFPLFTLGGLIFGMIWAYKAWGRYWGWDPKEVWSLVTWFIYALYLHTRVVMGWAGKKSAIVAVIGFLAALFTYFGVNYIIEGLHSYA